MDCSIVSLVTAKGESIAKGAKIVGVDPAYDLAFLKVVSRLGREIRHQMEPPLKDLFKQRLPLMLGIQVVHLVV